MKQTLFQTTLFLHVLAGILSLIFGLVAMVIRRKGGKWHNLSGKIFYWSMAFIFVTAILFVVLFPTSIKYHFFLMIGIVSFYPCFAGDRILSMKKSLNPKWFDWMAAAGILISGLVMLVYGFLLQAKGTSMYSVLFLIFGVLSLLNAYGDLRLYSGRTELEKMHWFFGHTAKMIGAFSAAVTAFCVNIVPRYLPEGTPMGVYIFTWVGPGIIFLFVTKYFVQKYKVKFKLV